MDDKIIRFPVFNSPMDPEAKKRFDEKIAKIEADSELYASYIFDGPDDNPLVRRYQESLVREFDDMFNRVIYGEKGKP